MATKLFDDAQLYRTKAIAERVPMSLRSLKALLSKLPRVAPTRRCVMFRGSDLNELFAVREVPAVRVLRRRAV